MDPIRSCFLAWVLFDILQQVTSLPISDPGFLQTVAKARLKRGTPTGNVYDPPTPVFPSKENAPFWIPAPYPIPTTVAPALVVRRKLPYYDPNNPYLDTMTDASWPNLGLGYANQNPSQVGGALHWPTGNALMPSDHFNGTLGFAQPQQLRLGMQGGPVFPFQNPQYIKTIKDINDANTLQQVAQTQSDLRTLSSKNSAQGIGFIPVQNQFFSRYQAIQRMPQRQPSFSAFPRLQ